jgi:hypothetical protein
MSPALHTYALVKSLLRVKLELRGKIEVAIAEDEAMLLEMERGFTSEELSEWRALGELKEEKVAS